MTMIDVDGGDDDGDGDDEDGNDEDDDCFCVRNFDIGTFDSTDFDDDGDCFGIDDLLEVFGTFRRCVC